LNDNKNTALYKFGNQNVAQSEPTPQKPYNINQNYFLHIDQPVPFDLNQTYFDPAEVREDGLFFRVHKGTKNKVIGNHHEANNQDYGE
jgi:hypothetical protein